MAVGGNERRVMVKEKEHRRGAATVVRPTRNRLPRDHARKRCGLAHIDRGRHFGRERCHDVRPRGKDVGDHALRHRAQLRRRTGERLARDGCGVRRPEVTDRARAQRAKHRAAIVRGGPGTQLLVEPSVARRRASHRAFGAALPAVERIGSDALRVLHLRDAGLGIAGAASFQEPCALHHGHHLGGMGDAERRVIRRRAPERELRDPHPALDEFRPYAADARRVRHRRGLARRGRQRGVEVLGGARAGCHVGACVGHHPRLPPRARATRGQDAGEAMQRGGGDGGILEPRAERARKLAAARGIGSPAERIEQRAGCVGRGARAVHGRVAAQQDVEERCNARVAVIAERSGGGGRFGGLEPCVHHVRGGRGITGEDRIRNARGTRGEPLERSLGKRQRCITCGTTVERCQKAVRPAPSPKRFGTFGLRALRLFQWATQASALFRGTKARVNRRDRVHERVASSRIEERPRSAERVRHALPVRAVRIGRRTAGHQPRLHRKEFLFTGRHGFQRIARPRGRARRTQDRRPRVDGGNGRRVARARCGVCGRGACVDAARHARCRARLGLGEPRARCVGCSLGGLRARTTRRLRRRSVGTIDRKQRQPDAHGKRHEEEPHADQDFHGAIGRGARHAR